MRVFIAILFFLFSGAAFAVEPDEILDDPALEARARAIDAQLRCVVCQSQSIAESDAPLAKDMRIVVRERLLAGDTDAEAIEFLSERYGDYVLLRPPVQTNTYLLWAFPALIVIAGAAGAVLYLRRAPQKPAPALLSPEEEEELKRILDERAP